MAAAAGPKISVAVGFISVRRSVHKAIPCFHYLLKAEKVYWLQSVAAVEVSLAPADRGGQLSHAENRLLMLHANREGNQDLRIAAIQ